MNADIQSGSSPVPSEPVDVGAELDRILRDPSFRRNPAAMQFLRFVVQETLEGRGDRLKAFTIATSVLGRGSDFDPQVNSVVRVQAKRLRELLENYYRGTGAKNPMHIVLPVGSYQPQFLRAVPVEEEVPPPRSEESVAPKLPRLLYPGHVVILLAALVLGTALLSRDVARLFGAQVSTPVLGLPSVLVQTDPPTSDEQTGLIATSLESALTHYDLTVMHNRTDADHQSAVDYVLLVRAGASDRSRRDFVFRLLSARSNEIIWSRAFQGIDVSVQSTADDRMVSTVAADVGELWIGAIMTDALRRSSSTAARNLQGTACVLRALDTILHYAYDLPQSLACLEAEVSRQPDDPRLLSLLSAVLVSEYLDGTPGRNPESDIARARELAERAASRSPKLGIGLVALFAARFFAGDPESAFELTPQILDGPPVSGLSQSLLAATNIARGHHDEDVALGAQLQAGAIQPTVFMPPYAALAAYMRNDAVNARRIVFRSEASPVPLTLLLRIALCATKQDEECAVRAAERLARCYPGVASDIPAALDRYGLGDELKRKLLADLRRGRPLNDAAAP
ncbi:hypothetical protein [Bradyrhizobium sp. SZCCHNS2005]|uniref:hypothetical protein n=1 Tax=Bradyrhizobium sp. SZCCHNS2005 TaxID=3057303 RepID=UPI0028E3F369|nr:hypothetical protein [Bradyrhizobium sp. SZCCHNS2005]